jgi:hypothetical protein
MLKPWWAMWLFCALASASCAPRALVKLPSGPGTPSGTDIAAVQVDALRACNAVTSMTIEVAVSGSVGGQRVRGRLLAGFQPPAARLEAVAPFGAPLFILAERGGDATLLLPRDERVLEHGRPEQVLAAIAGVALGPSDLFRTLTACHIPDALGSPMAIGDAWRTAAGGGGAKVYFHRQPPAAWRTVAVFFAGEGLRSSWRAEYADFQNGLPRTIRLVSAEPTRFDLRLELSQVETNMPLGPDVFRVEIPSSYRRMSIDDLRTRGPLAGRSDDR